VSSVIPARRRAEKFAALVEGHAPAGRDVAAYADLLQLVGDLRTSAGPTPRPDFVSELRASLMTEADAVLLKLERDLALPSAKRSGRRHPHRRLAIAAGALTFVGATASMSYAAQTALPGDALYPVKRAIENAQTGLSSGDHKTEEIFGNASARLDEVRALSERHTAESDAQVPGTIHDFTEQAQEGGLRALASDDDKQVTQLREFAADSMRELESLDTVVPEQARDELAAAAELIASLDQQALTACPSCGGAVLNLPPIFLTSGSETTPLLPGQLPSDLPPGSVTDPGTLPGQSSSGPSLPGTSDVPVLPGSTPTTGPSSGPLLPTGTTNTDGPLGPITSALPTGSTDGPLGPIISPILPPVSSAVDDVTGGLGGLLNP
jgi:hypothetical protein